MAEGDRPAVRPGTAWLAPPDGDGGTVPWRWFLDAAAGLLGDAGVAAPGQEARWMVEECAGWRGGEAALRLDEPAPRLAVTRLQEVLERRLAGEPLQYALGSWAFRRLELLVDRRVLIPRPETEGVVDHALATLDRRAGDDPGRPLVAADLGTGTGAIALSLAVERPAVLVHATDRSAEALDVARANLAGVGAAGTRVTLHLGSWFDALPGELRGRLDLVVSNPPYVAATEELPDEVVRWEPSAALVAGPEGTEALAHLVDEAFDWLVGGGGLVLELAPHQAGWAAERAHRRGYVDVVVAVDATGRERALVATRG